MLDALLRMLVLDLIIFNIYIFVVIPIHEVGHMVAFRHYGVKSAIRLGDCNSGVDGTRGKSLAYCSPYFWTDSFIFIEDDKKDAVVSFGGAGASIIFCLCMYIIFPLNAFLFVVLFEGVCGLAEIKEGWAKNERFRQGNNESLWYMESKEEHEFFAEEVARCEYEGLVVPILKTYLRVEGFDLKEFE